MRISVALGCAVAAAGWLWPSQATAQVFETVGTRAQGMAGAFVAVADDANASWWNPAGLATGAYLSMVIERGSLTDPPDVPAEGPARAERVVGWALAVPSLGISYYRVRVGEIRPASSPSSTGVGGPDRQEGSIAGIRRRSRLVSEFGATVGQSLGDHVVVASKLKLMRAGAADGIADADGARALVDAVEGGARRETHGALDVGVMVSFTHARFGLSLKNVNEPEFGDGSDRLLLTRQARAGLALVSDRVGPIDALVVAVDADLTTQATVRGDARRLAAGAEAWVFGRRVGVRGGVSVNMAGGARSPSTGGGLTVAVRSGLYVDGAVTVGPDGSRSAWSTALRVGF